MVKGNINNTLCNQGKKIKRLTQSISTKKTKLAPQKQLT